MECVDLYVVEVCTLCIRNKDDWRQVLTFRLPMCLIVYIVVTEYCVSLHSLDANKFGDVGCTVLGAALKLCRNLQVLR